MNVGGHRLTNDELRARFAEIGLRELACFRASGNVIFAGESQPPAAVAARIEEGLAGSLGYAVPTFIRTTEEIRAIAAMQPFDPELVQASGGKLQVSLLASLPSPQARAQLLSLASEEDRLAFGERELYWLPSGGMLESGLDLKAIDELTGTSTRRTKNTIEQIASRYFAD
jgi:uncharacterized protein (DUF1697 family)